MKILISFLVLSALTLACKSQTAESPRTKVRIDSSKADPATGSDEANPGDDGDDGDDSEVDTDYDPDSPEEESDEVVEGLSDYSLYKFEVSDLAKPAELSPMDETQLKDKLSQLNFYTPDSTATQAETKTPECAAIDKQLIGKVFDGTLVVDIEADGAACLNSMETDKSNFYKSVTMKFHNELRCEGMDLESYNNKVVPTELKCETTTHFLNNFQVNAVIEKTFPDPVSGKSIKALIHLTQFQSKSTANNEPCTLTSASGVKSSTGCVEILKSNVNGEWTEYSRIESKNHKWASSTKDKWYQVGGTSSLAINDWTGTVTYKGASSAPVYELTKGAKTVSGMLPVVVPVVTGETMKLGLHSAPERSPAIPKLPRLEFLK